MSRPDYLHGAPIDLEAPGAAAFFDELSFWSSRFGDLLLRKLPLGKDLAVLDLGTGTGFPLLELAQMLGPGARLTGADPWAGGLKRAEAKRQFLGLPGVNLVRCDGASLPFRDGAFDRIVSNLGINNFADPPRVLAECRRVIVSGGILAMATNLRGHMGQFYTIYHEVLSGQRDAARLLSRLEAEENHRASRQGIESLLAASGFRVARVVEKTLTRRYLDGSALLRHFLTRLGFLDGWRSVVPVEDQDAVFATLEDRLNAAARQKGELQLTVPMLYVEAVPHA